MHAISTVPGAIARLEDDINDAHVLKMPVWRAKLTV